MEGLVPVLCWLLDSEQHFEGRNVELKQQHEKW